MFLRAASVRGLLEQGGLIEGDIANKFMAAVLEQEAVKALLSDDHFSVDGTLIEAWASMKSFRLKDGSSEPPAPGRNGERDFHGEKRSNETHASTTDPEVGHGGSFMVCYTNIDQVSYFIGHVPNVFRETVRAYQSVSSRRRRRRHRRRRHGSDGSLIASRVTKKPGHAGQPGTFSAQVAGRRREPLRARHPHRA
jgi:hypothetical protein